MKKLKYKIGDFITYESAETGEVVDCEIVYIDKSDTRNKPYLIVPIDPTYSNTEWLRCDQLINSGKFSDENYKKYILPFGRRRCVWPLILEIQPLMLSLESLVKLLNDEIK